MSQRPKKVKKSFSIDERSAELIKVYAGELHLSESAFVSMMVTQIDQVIRSLGEVTAEYEKASAGQPECEQ